MTRSDAILAVKQGELEIRPSQIDPDRAGLEVTSQAPASQFIQRCSLVRSAIVPHRAIRIVSRE